MMAVRTEDELGKYRLLFAFIMLSNISLSTSISLDLTKLENKVGQRWGNQWAIGNFMGKKSISNSQLQDYPLPSETRRNTVEDSVSSSGNPKDLRELITDEVLKVALQADLEDTIRTQDLYNQDMDFKIKLLKNYIEKRK